MYHFVIFSLQSILLPIYSLKSNFTQLNCLTQIQLSDSNVGPREYYASERGIITITISSEETGMELECKNKMTKEEGERMREIIYRTTANLLI